MEEESIFVHELEQIWQCIHIQLRNILNPRLAYFSSLLESQVSLLRKI